MNFLSPHLKDFALKNRNDLRELRIRKDMPVMANIAGQYSFIKINGDLYIPTKNEIDSIVSVACKGSIFAFNDAIKQGYINCDNGIRIGVAGECVCENGCLKTIKNFFSLCVRFPHQIFNFSKTAFEIINVDNSVKSLLVIAPPCTGKTTLLRDLSRIISNIKMLNILLIDEKNEIFYDSCDIGNTTDVLSRSNKNFGFYTAIKTLSPQVVICDELVSEDDAKGVEFASLSGVKVICSVHGDSLESVKNKPYMKRLFDNKVFEKFILIVQNGKCFEIVEV